MKNIIIIASKEIRVFFTSPMFYVISLLMTIVMSYIYPIQLGQFAQVLQTYVMQPGVPHQQLNIHYGVFLKHLSFLNLIFIFLVPAITMRLISEEKKMRTMDLLMTSPVTSLEIVIGKYLAGLAAIFSLSLVALLYPIATISFATINWGPLLIAFGGIFLVGAVYVAMDLFCSSLTEQSIVAFVMSFVMNLAIWFVGMAVDVVDSPLARQIFEHISLNAHLGSLVEGTVRTNALVFLVSLIVLFVFITERVVESSRWRS